MFSKLAACLRPHVTEVPKIISSGPSQQPLHGSAQLATGRSPPCKPQDVTLHAAISTTPDAIDNEDTDASILSRVRLGETFFSSAELLSVKGSLSDAEGQELLVSFTIQQSAPERDQSAEWHVHVARRRALVCETLQAPADDDDVELMLGGCGGSFGTAATASCSPASGTTLASTCVTGGATTSGGGYARTGSGAVDSRLASGVTAEFAISTASGVAAAGAAACAVRASSGSGGASGGGLSLYARGIRCVSGPVVLRPNQQASLASPARDQERRQSPAEMPVACISGTGLIGPGGSTPCFASSQSSRRLFGPAGGFGGAGWGGRLLRCAMAQRNGDIAAALASLQQHMQPPLILGPPPGGAPMQQQVLVAAVDELPAGSRTLLHFIQQQCASHAGSEPAAASGPGPGFNSLDQLRMLTSMALQIARGMEHLHAHGQSHGSLSPCAVFVSPAAPGGGEQQPGAKEEEAVPVEGRARSGSSPYSPRSVFHAPVCCKIALAGLVNPMELASHLAIHPGEWGPVSYMAPECFAAGSSGGSPSSSNGTGTGGGGGAGRALSGIASGGVGASPLMRVDVNAYGALIYHMFNGVAPFHQYHPAQVLVGLASGGLQLQWRPQLYGSRRAPVPDAIRSLVIRCMSHTPVARPTFHEIVRILECLAQTI